MPAKPGGSGPTDAKDQKTTTSRIISTRVGTSKLYTLIQLSLKRTAWALLHHQGALLIAQSRGYRTLDAVALRGSLARLRDDVESIYDALQGGELPLAFPSLFKRRRPGTSPGRRRRPSAPAELHQAWRCRPKTRLPCPCRRPRRRCVLPRPRRARLGAVPGYAARLPDWAGGCCFHAAARRGDAVPDVGDDVNVVW
jgi:hypothetical protein